MVRKTRRQRLILYNIKSQHARVTHSCETMGSDCAGCFLPFQAVSNSWSCVYAHRGPGASTMCVKRIGKKTSFLIARGCKIWCRQVLMTSTTSQIGVSASDVESVHACQIERSVCAHAHVGNCALKLTF